MIVGISFPFRKGSRGFPEPAFDDKCVKESMEQIVLTSPRERVMRPTLGTISRKYLHENVDDATRAAVRHDVVAQIGILEPRARIETADVVEEETSEGTALVTTIRWSLTADPPGSAADTLEVTL